MIWSLTCLHCGMQSQEQSSLAPGPEHLLSWTRAAWGSKVLLGRECPFSPTHHHAWVQYGSDAPTGPSQLMEPLPQFWGQSKTELLSAGKCLENPWIHLFPLSELRTFFDLSIIDSLILLNIFTHLAGSRCVCCLTRPQVVITCSPSENNCSIIAWGWPTLVHYHKFLLECWTLTCQDL